MGDRRFEGRRAAVTGAGGFIGNAICRRLAADGAAVLGLDVNPAAAARVRGAGAAFVEADVADREALGAAFDETHLVVHTAAHAHERGSVVLRPGDVYGPGSVPWTLRPLQMARAGQLAVPGRGDGLMLPVYIDDLAEAIVLALAGGEPGQAYAVWDDASRVTFEEHFNRLARFAGYREARRLPRPVLELAGMAMEGWAKLRGKPPAFTARAATFIDRRGTVSVAKAHEQLGWEPGVPYEEGMHRTEQWLRA